MEPKLYYTAPSDEAFEDMRQAALKVWEKYKREPDYYKEKTERIKVMKNIQDNFMYLFAMFDHLNQRECVSYLKPSTRDELQARMIDGGNAPWHIESIFSGLPNDS